MRLEPRLLCRRVTVLAYGDFSQVTDTMTTHWYIGAQEWTLRGRWSGPPMGRAVPHRVRLSTD